MTWSNSSTMHLSVGDQNHSKQYTDIARCLLYACCVVCLLGTYQRHLRTECTTHRLLIALH